MRDTGRHDWPSRRSDRPSRDVADGQLHRLSQGGTSFRPCQSVRARGSSSRVWPTSTPGFRADLRHPCRPRQRRTIVLASRGRRADAARGGWGAGQGAAERGLGPPDGGARPEQHETGPSPTDPGALVPQVGGDLAYLQAHQEVFRFDFPTGGMLRFAQAGTPSAPAAPRAHSRRAARPGAASHVRERDAARVGRGVHGAGGRVPGQPRRDQVAAGGLPAAAEGLRAVRAGEAGSRRMRR